MDLHIAKQHNLRFGITGGYYQFRLNPTGAIAFDAQDVIVNSGSQSSSSINSEVGFLYQFKGLELSFASKQVTSVFFKFWIYRFRWLWIETTHGWFSWL